MQEKILVAGATDMNLTLPMRSVPPAGSDVTEDGKPHYTAGGGGAASAVALAKLGAAPVLLSRVGADVHGRRLLRLYGEVGVDGRFVSTDPRAATGLRIILREAGGDRRTVYYPGANREFPLMQAEQAIVETGPCGVFLPMDLAPDVTVNLSRLCASYSLPLFLDATGIPADFPLASLGRAEIFCPDDREAYAITGTYPVGSDSCLKAAVELEKRVKARYYVIRLGERGLFLYDGRYCHMIPGFGVRMPEGAPLCGTLSAVLSLGYLRSGGDVMAACRYALGYHALLLRNAAVPGYLPEDDEVREFVRTH